MNMMRKNNNRDNRGGGNKHRGGGGGGGRRYQSGGTSRGGANDGQNLQRQKHHATQQLGKYGELARNAQINGDRVDVEYYLQHVDHYTRVLADIAGVEAERYAHQREAQIIPGGPNDPAANQTGSGYAASADAVASSAHGEAEETNQHGQPRNSRQSYYDSSDNGAKEANRNNEDIPLPGGIIPPI